MLYDAPKIRKMILEYLDSRLPEQNPVQTSVDYLIFVFRDEIGTEDVKTQLYWLSGRFIVRLYADGQVEYLGRTCRVHWATATTTRLNEPCGKPAAVVATAPSGQEILCCALHAQHLLNNCTTGLYRSDRWSVAPLDPEGLDVPKITWEWKEEEA